MLNLEKLVVHNFGSYKHSEICLQNKGFCLVSGQNLCKKDNANSNGSGKSFLWNAICFALTGETVNGLHTNLKNIHVVDDPTCYVTLIFSDGADHYQITRHVTPKSDLKIIKNDIDLSGKGIRESEKKLQDVLPNLTKNLITSIIIIGQGMPNKFSSFSPSGRKELLEKLTRADFMIEDIKQRVSLRLTELSNQLRTYEDACLARKSQVNFLTTQLKQKQAELANFEKPDFDAQAAIHQAAIEQLDIQIAENVANTCTKEASLTELSNQLFNLSNAKSDALSNLKAKNDEATFEAINQQASFRAEIKTLTEQIKQYKSIVDVCPTCHQKIPGAAKPDTSALNAALDFATHNLARVDEYLRLNAIQHQKQFTEISSQYEQQLAAVQAAVNNLRTELNTERKNCKVLEQNKTIHQQKLNRIQYDKETWDARYSDIQVEICNITATLAKEAEMVTAIETDINTCNDHLKVVRKMDVLIKRDFRGFLLSNIINYIDKKAKDYCSIVFGTRELEVSLDDNNLNIAYCGKMFDNLSGGEKQRVDLILQFAIRNMLTVYLNFNSNILVLDEITDFLDKKSCAAVLELITKELNTIESVFVISHHASALALPVDSELVIRKNELGISEIISGV